MKYFIKRSDEVVKNLIGKKRYFVFPLFILQSLLEIFTLIDPLTPPILASIVETPSFSASMLFAGSISILSLDDLIKSLFWKNT